MGDGKQTAARKILGVSTMTNAQILAKLGEGWTEERGEAGAVCFRYSIPTIPTEGVKLVKVDGVWVSVRMEIREGKEFACFGHAYTSLKKFLAAFNPAAEACNDAIDLAGLLGTRKTAGNVE